MKSISHETIAATHYYFVTGVFEQQDDNHPLHEGTGQIEYVLYLYPFSVAIDEAYQVAPERDCPGVFDYEVSEDLAATLFHELVLDEGADLPDVKRWRELIAELVDLWCKEKVDWSKDLLPQLEALNEKK